ncbi:MAG TPA: PAS domain S-box protein, partial [Terriglobales bacterium]|nr:PAS domain S-box protein [Terriglobales bacterium]
MILVLWTLTLTRQYATVLSIDYDRVDPLFELYAISRDLSLIDELISAEEGAGGEAADNAETVERMGADTNLLQRLRVDIDTQFNRYLQTYLTDDEALVAKTARQQIEALEQLLGKPLQLASNQSIAGNKNAQRSDADRAEAKRLVDATLRSITILVGLQKDVSTSSLHSAQQSYAYSLSAIILSALLGVGGIAYLMLLGRRSLLVPIDKALTLATSLTQENSPTPLAAARLDELGELLARLEVAKRRSNEPHDQKADDGGYSQVEAWFTALFENCPFGIFIKNMNGEFLMINDADAKIRGKSKEDVVGRKVKDVTSAREFLLLSETDLAVTEHGMAVSTDYRGTENTPYDLMRVIKFPIRSKNGELAAIAGIEIDLSEQFRSHASLRRFAQHMDHVSHVAKLMSWIWHVDARTGIKSYEYSRERLMAWCGLDELPTELDDFLP